MLKRLSNIFRRSTPTTPNGPKTLRSGQHDLSPQKISSGARKVVEQLSNDGYDAYLVGGCVRDLMMDLKPKDFDVATDATPEQVKQLFRRSRIVGRRFQIVHVRMGSEIIEVTTFRAHHTDKKNHREKSQHSAKGMLLRDNMFGSIDEDASRRDFTMNAFYYHPQDNSVYDYANGLPDIEQRLVRIIGNPADRYKEDPVRMLRALRFAAKLGFKIEHNTANAIGTTHQLLADIPPARLYDEVLKLLMNGQALATFQLLRQYQLFGILFPATEAALSNDPGYYLKFIEQALHYFGLRSKKVRKNFYNKVTHPSIPYKQQLEKLPLASVNEWLYLVASRFPCEKFGSFNVVCRAVQAIRLSDYWKTNVFVPAMTSYYYEKMSGKLSQDSVNGGQLFRK